MSSSVKSSKEKAAQRTQYQRSSKGKRKETASEASGQRQTQYERLQADCTGDVEFLCPYQVAMCDTSSTSDASIVACPTPMPLCDGIMDTAKHEWRNSSTPNGSPSSGSAAVLTLRHDSSDVSQRTL
ncbi:hypothetical protein NUW54_g2128 [Trametes sanguinea]|uniref:Uncharacterized protein n=1 Tax=Trametes sanguinea TaxID=158606 RepID=A0ACC1Q4D9_9APHY|nr:hypothetical protein NUW54_g2128 [Trametes sanguinea]